MTTGTSDAAVACAVAVVTGIGVTEATAVVGVDGTAVTLGDAGDGETDGTVALATGLGVDTADVVVSLGVDGAVAWAGVGAVGVATTCPEASWVLDSNPSALASTSDAAMRRPAHRSACRAIRVP